MTLKLIDGFDYYPYGDGNAVIRNFYADGWFGDVQTQGGSLGVFPGVEFASGQGLAAGWSDLLFNKGVGRTLSGQHYEGEFILGHRFIIGEVGTYGFSLYSTMNTAGTQFSIQFSPDGSVRVFNGNGALVTGCPAGTLYALSWIYLEMKFTIGEDALFEVRANTKVILSVPNINLGNGTPILGYGPGFDVINYSTTGHTAGQLFLWDDFYLLDTLGTVNNDYLGQIKVVYQDVVGEDSVQWAIGGTAPAATNWQSVLNAHLDDSKYVQTRVMNNRDLYNANPSVNSAAIYGVQVKGAYKVDDAGQRVVKNTLQTNLGTDLVGTDWYVDQTYRYYQDIFELNPDTGVGWTDLEVNDLLIGPKDVTPP